MKKTKSLSCILIALHGLFIITSTAFAQNSAFTYQGQLIDGGSPANGIYDFQFSVHDVASGGSIVGGPLTNLATTVGSGLFVVTLDFGAAVFNGSPRWLEISVRTNGGSEFTALAPRPEVTPTPYAMHAQNLSASGLAGTYGSAVTLDNPANQFSGTFTGNGAALTNVNATTLGGLSSSNFWQLGGNAGTATGLNFVGTTDSQPLELKVNGTRALRLEPAPETPNVVGGVVSNSVAPGIRGATIAGGGLPLYPNQITADFAAIGGGTFHIAGGAWVTIAGGRDNRALSESSTVAGGFRNLIETNSNYGAIGGGFLNEILPGASSATIAGGNGNQIDNGSHFSAVGGGYFNNIRTQAFASIIAGGYLNVAETNAAYSVIGGGRNNTNQPNSSYATIAGGFRNQVGSSVVAGTVGGGENNRATANHATVAGGLNNANSGPGATIGGGNGNVTVANDTVIGGGIFNLINTNAYASTLSGGRENSIQTGSESATIGGGYQNQAAATEATISGGGLNRAWAFSSTIGGGGGNSVSGTWTTIAGGRDGLIGTNSHYAAIGGGLLNQINESSASATIGGGDHNRIHSSSTGATIAGGDGNRVLEFSPWATIAGGSGNLIGTNSLSSVIGGGLSTIIETNASTATISGGWLNRIGEFAHHGTVGGGYLNQIGTNGYASTIAGGDNNTIQNDARRASIGGGQSNSVSANWSAIPGGRDNAVAGDYSLAAGRRAKANTPGTFVWADSTAADFASTAANQFLIRANGGVGINTNNPTAKLHIGGTPGVDGIRFPDGTLQTTAATPPAAAPSLYFANGPGSNPATTNAFLASPVTVTITSVSQKVLVTSHKAFGSISVAGANNLSLYIGYRLAGLTASPTTVGNGVFGNRVTTNTRITMGLSAVITGLAPGNYQVGLMGASSDAANWNSNEYSYTTATVY